jgi:hypothetical protein
MGRKFGDSNGGKPFLQRSGKSPAFKMVGSSPAKDTEPHTGKGGHEHIKEELGFKKYDIQEDGSIKVTREGIGTTTTPATVEKGKSYTEAGVDPAEAKAYWEANPEKRKEYEASLTTPGTTTTEDISTAETVEKPTRKQRYRYETTTSYKDHKNTKKPIVFNGKRMNQEEYDALIKAGGWTPDPNKRYTLRRRSTTGKGTPYDPDMVDISEKADFDYSGVDYGDVGYRQFKNSEERQKFMDYNELLNKAKRQGEVSR